MSIDLWRYQVGERWYYVTRDPAAITRSGEKLIVFTQREFEDLMLSLTEDTILARTKVKHR